MKTSVSCQLLSVLLAGLCGSAPAVQEVVKEGFGFSLLPNAMAQNPRLVMTVFTEMTDHGRALPAVSTAAPVYFVAHDDGRKARGEEAGESVFPTPAALQEILFRSLATNGYQPAAEGQSPGLALVYYWGSHHGMMDLEETLEFRQVYQQQILERAMLVGGTTYRTKVAEEFAHGTTFADRIGKKGFLFDQASKDIYFVVVSAYDHAELLEGRRRLAWRTMMTVSTTGIAMRDALPPLVVTAADYFGRETGEPLAIIRRARRGTVTLGPMEIVEDRRQPDLARN